MCQSYFEPCEGSVICSDTLVFRGHEGLGLVGKSCDELFIFFSRVKRDDLVVRQTFQSPHGTGLLVNNLILSFETVRIKGSLSNKKP